MSRTYASYAVVGGGIAGLTAAYRLRAATGDSARITLFDPAEQLGGALHTIRLAGHQMEVGAEAFVARRPEVPALARRLLYLPVALFALGALAAGPLTRLEGCALFAVAMQIVTGIVAQLDERRQHRFADRLQRWAAANPPPPTSRHANDASTPADRFVAVLTVVARRAVRPVAGDPHDAQSLFGEGLLMGMQRLVKYWGPGRRYPHLAIHPYPSELEGEIALRDGTRLPVRPMRPEDTELELAFFRGLSERSRYHRFMQHLPELPPRMLARFTQLDYDRELALVALHDGAFVAVGRYAPNLDGGSAEFAITVADAWQAKGIGRALLERLCQCAREAGYEALYGYILADNRDMLQLALKLGFAEVSRADEVVVMRKL